MTPPETEHNNPIQEHPFHAHEAKFAILANRTSTVEKHIDLLLERTEPIAGIAATIIVMNDSINKLCNDFSKHKEEQRDSEEEVDTKLVESVTTSAGLKTKTDILWYVVIVLVLGAILAKLLIPSLGL